jgi:hypothetical protein
MIAVGVESQWAVLGLGVVEVCARHRQLLKLSVVVVAQLMS